MLTEFGRQFKLGGYTMSTGQSELPPLAVMLQPSFTHTNKGQDGGAARQNFKPVRFHPVKLPCARGQHFEANIPRRRL